MNGRCLRYGCGNMTIKKKLKKQLTTIYYQVEYMTCGSKEVIKEADYTPI